MLPSFIIIGAMKAGTSSLYRYLDAHPEISMSHVKETNLFLGDPAAGQDLERYQALFDGDAKICGEASPNYAKRHLHPDVPARIHALIPDAKLIYVLRDPIDRLVSHYLHNLTHGRERRTLAQALANPDRSNLVLTSRYFFQLELFLDYFSEDRMMMIAMEDLKVDRRSFFQRIFDFLGVDRDFEDRGSTRSTTPRRTGEGSPFSTGTCRAGDWGASLVVPCLPLWSSRFCPRVRPWMRRIGCGSRSTLRRMSSS